MDDSTIQQPIRQPSQLFMSRPHITVVLAMSADGKITDAARSAARFPSAVDKAHLESQVARADATLFGAGTLRAYGTTLMVSNPALLDQRRSRYQPDQPIHIVCSAMGKLDRQWTFFQQPLPRWLITTTEGIQRWRADSDGHRPFCQVLINERPFNWHAVMQDLRTGKSGLSATTQRQPIERLVVMGGGELVASLLTDGLIDELYLTVCPLLIGGKTAPSPVSGLGFVLPRTPQLRLQSSVVKGDEVFLHYLVESSAQSDAESNAKSADEKTPL
ncbi:MAG: RibD family protein [Cyanobacteria bacterium J06623_5]